MLKEFKEIMSLLLHFKFKELFFDATTSGLLQFFRYAFVGAIASVADWATLFILTELGVYYILSSVLAFVVGLVINFALSKAFVFNSMTARTNVWSEFLGYAAIGGIGLGMTVLLMYVLTEKVQLYYMVSKIISTVIVLIWNYLARKIFIYK